MIAPTLQCPCDGRHRRLAWEYTAPPRGETRFDLGATAYRRAYDRCDLCGHLFGRHDLDLTALYEKDYVDATYGGPDGMRRRFETIMSLPSTRSDNRARVARVLAFAAERGFSVKPRPRLLDIGAGLGVFPAAMQEAGWAVLALEPDARTVVHLREVAKVEALCEDLLRLDPATTGTFDAISLNKVLEHVEDPVRLLAATRPFLSSGGFVYVEVPDVAAVAEGAGREEFFIEHHHVFSPGSLVLTAEKTGFDILTLERVRESSTKFTLRAFLASSQPPIPIPSKRPSRIAIRRGARPITRSISARRRPIRRCISIWCAA